MSDGNGICRDAAEGQPRPTRPPRSTAPPWVGAGSVSRRLRRSRCCRLQAPRRSRSREYVSRPLRRSRCCRGRRGRNEPHHGAPPGPRQDLVPPQPSPRRAHPSPGTAAPAPHLADADPRRPRGGGTPVVVPPQPQLEAAARATLAHYDTTSFATRLRVPTLVSLGQADTTCPPDSVRAMFERIPSCKALLEVPGPLRALAAHGDRLDAGVGVRVHPLGARGGGTGRQVRRPRPGGRCRRVGPRADPVSIPGSSFSRCAAGGPAPAGSPRRVAGARRRPARRGGQFHAGRGWPNDARAPTGDQL